MNDEKFLIDQLTKIIDKMSNSPSKILSIPDLCFFVPHCLSVGKKLNSESFLLIKEKYGSFDDTENSFTEMTMFVVRNLIDSEDPEIHKAFDLLSQETLKVPLDKAFDDIIV